MCRRWAPLDDVDDVWDVDEFVVDYVDDVGGVKEVGDVV